MRSPRRLVLTVALALALLVPPVTAAFLTPEQEAWTGSAVPGTAPAAAAPAAAARGTLSEFPLRFEPNLGQADPTARFIAHTSGGTLLLSEDGFLHALHPEDPAATQAAHLRDGPPATGPLTFLRTTFPGASRDVTLEAGDLLEGVSHYLFGAPLEGVRDVPGFARVTYRGLYPGIDLVMYEAPGGGLEYDVVVAPGADPGIVRLAFSGHASLDIDPSGDLRIGLSEGTVVMTAPVIYQASSTGDRIPVAGRFALNGDGTVAFAVEAYDPSRPLVIDPRVLYEHYRYVSWGEGVTVDATGSAFVTGGTRYGYRPSGGWYAMDYADAYVLKLHPDGSLAYRTYLSGSATDAGTEIALDVSGHPTIGGYTDSPSFPVSPDAFQRVKASTRDAFVARLSADGSTLLASTLLGGPGDDAVGGLKLDAAGNVVVAGTAHAGFPTTPDATPIVGSHEDAFFARLAANGSTLTYATLFGGEGFDRVTGLALDAAGHVYLAGITGSPTFPVVAALDPTFNGLDDVFVMKLGPDNTLLYSTFIGGPNFDGARGIALGPGGDLYVGGFTYSFGRFPMTAQRLSGWCNSENPYAYPPDGFLLRLAADGRSLRYSTPVCGSEVDAVRDVVVDSKGNAYITGLSDSTDLPTHRAGQAGSGTLDAFLLKVAPTGDSLVYGTFIATADEDRGLGVAIDGKGLAFVTGNFGSRLFVFKMGPAPPGAPTHLVAAPIPGYEKIKLVWQPPQDDGGSDIVRYRIYRTLPGIPDKLVGDVWGALTFTDTVSTSAAPRYKVSAVSEGGEGPMSAPATGYVLVVPGAPGLPVIVATGTANSTETKSVACTSRGPVVLEIAPTLGEAHLWRAGPSSCGAPLPVTLRGSCTHLATGEVQCREGPAASPTATLVLKPDGRFEWRQTAGTTMRFLEGHLDRN